MDEHHLAITHDDLINPFLPDGLAAVIPKIAKRLMNAAKHIGAGPRERVESCNGHAKGFHPRSNRPHAEAKLGKFIHAYRKTAP